MRAHTAAAIRPALFLLFLAWPSLASATMHYIQMGNPVAPHAAFVPHTTFVRVGDVVRFINIAAFPNSVEFSSVPLGVLSDALDSWTWFNEPLDTYDIALYTVGTYAFASVPEIRTGMNGTIVVSA